MAEAFTMKRTMATKMIVMSNELRTRGSMPGAIRSEIITRSSAWAAMHHLQKSRYARGVSYARPGSCNICERSWARTGIDPSSTCSSAVGLGRDPDVDSRFGLGGDDVLGGATADHPDVDGRAGALVGERLEREGLVRELLDGADSSGPVRPRMGRAARDPQREAAEP